MLGSRDLRRGQHAFVQLGSPSNVNILQLDMSSNESIFNAIDEIRRKYGENVDVVVNNAGMMTTEISIDAARQSFKTNYYGIKLLNELIVDLMRRNGRIVNVSSRVGTTVLQESSFSLQEKYTSTILTIDRLDQLVEEFLSAIETQTIESLGYNLKSNYLIYGVTKAALNSLTQIEAREWSNTKNLLVVSVTPGLCATEMVRDIPHARSPELGADSILYVINTSKEQLENGKFYRDGKVLLFVGQTLSFPPLPNTK